MVAEAAAGLTVRGAVQGGMGVSLAFAVVAVEGAMVERAIAMAAMGVMVSSSFDTTASQQVRVVRQLRSAVPPCISS
jgi:hypothetical protein